MTPLRLVAGPGIGVPMGADDDKGEDRNYPGGRRRLLEIVLAQAPQLCGEVTDEFALEDHPRLGIGFEFAQTGRLHGWSQSWFDMMLEGGQRWETV